MSVKMLDIAKKLNVSLMTVSRTLNNKGYVKEETKRKILKVAEEMGYIPNALAKGLALNKTFNIGLVITDISNPFYSTITKVVQEEASRNGYRLTMFNTNEDFKIEEEALNSIMAQRCDGALLTSASKDFRHVYDLQKNKFPIVLLNRKPDVEDLDYVVCDNKRGAFLAIEYLLKLGHRNIAHLTGPSYITSVREKIDGYNMAFNKKGLEINPELIFETEISLKGSYKATIKALKKNPYITAIFTYTNWMAIGAYRALEETGKKIPDDISVIGYDNIKVSSLLSAPLTTIDIPIRPMGRKAIDILLKKINGENNQFHKIYKPVLIERKSCREI
jgi:LacI family transcriptional regulator